jgi:hypothetical protein
LKIPMVMFGKCFGWTLDIFNRNVPGCLIVIIKALNAERC